MYYCFRCEWYEVKANLMKGDFGEGKYRYWCATVIIAVCFITYYHRHKKFFISNIFDILELMFIDLIKSLLSLDLRKYLFIFIVCLKSPSNNRFLRVTYLALQWPNLPHGFHGSGKYLYFILNNANTLGVWFKMLKYSDRNAYVGLPGVIRDAGDTRRSQ